MMTQQGQLGLVGWIGSGSELEEGGRPHGRWGDDGGLLERRGSEKKRVAGNQISASKSQHE